MPLVQRQPERVEWAEACALTACSSRLGRRGPCPICSNRSHYHRAHPAQHCLTPLATMVSGWRGQGSRGKDHARHGNGRCDASMRMTHAARTCCSRDHRWRVLSAGACCGTLANLARLRQRAELVDHLAVQRIDRNGAIVEDLPSGADRSVASFSRKGNALFDVRSKLERGVSAGPADASGQECERMRAGAVGAPRRASLALSSPS